MVDSNAPETALRNDLINKIDDIESADIVLGVPAYESEHTIKEVVEVLSSGVAEIFPDRKSVLIVSDGGSLDDTREEALNASVPESVEKCVTIYRGLAGKGTALRVIFETADRLGAQAGMVVDSDMRQWPPEWTRRHLTPILDDDMDLMTPRYRRHKYDATITNGVCFPLISTLYGKWVRQPIGGDFAMSGELMSFYASQDEWDTDVARFGIDIWMTTTALCEGYNVGQTNLGAKIHDPKDPGEALGPMFREVVGTLFRLAGRYKNSWWNVDDLETVKTFSDPLDVEPEPVPVNRPALVDKAVKRWEKHKNTIETCLSPATYSVVEDVMKALSRNESLLSFLTPTIWVRVLYDYLVAYNTSSLESETIMNSLIPLYFARTWSFYHEMDPLAGEEAEIYTQELVDDFREQKDHLRNRWEQEINDSG